MTNSQTAADVLKELATDQSVEDEIRLQAAMTLLSHENERSLMAAADQIGDMEARLEALEKHTGVPRVVG